MEAERKTLKSHQLLAQYILSLPDFPDLSKETGMERYHHMGAVIVDTILQPGLNYDSTVFPRVKKVQAIEEARTTSGFLKILITNTPEKVLDWRDAEKPARVLAATQFFFKIGIETEDELQEWLKIDSHKNDLKQLRGVGDKTADYFRLLVGLTTSAIDRHLSNLIQMAGLRVEYYQGQRELIEATAHELNVESNVLDHTIWKYMSRKNGKTKNCN